MGINEFNVAVMRLMALFFGVGYSQITSRSLRVVSSVCKHAYTQKVFKGYAFDEGFDVVDESAETLSFDDIARLASRKGTWAAFG